MGRPVYNPGRNLPGSARPQRTTARGVGELEPVAYARKAVAVASDKQASDILLLDIRKVGTFADFFVIMTAETQRHMESLSHDLVDVLTTSGASLHHQEGTAAGGWLLLDFGDVIVHLFAPGAREYYQLEGRWSKAKQVVRIQ
ncbi:MAG: ribosome silencing factor [Chloroflexi bacterium]|nr:ribosome silencing factor [Chloroflexota bacterium]